MLEQTSPTAFPCAGLECHCSVGHTTGTCCAHQRASARQGAIKARPDVGQFRPVDQRLSVGDSRRGAGTVGAAACGQ